MNKETKKLLKELKSTNNQFKVTYYYSPTELRPRRLQLMPKEIEDLLKEYEEASPRNFVYEMIEVPQKNLTEDGAVEEKKEYSSNVLAGENIESEKKTEVSDDASEDEKAAFKIRKFLEEENIGDIKELTYEGDKKTYQSFYSAFYITYGSSKPFKYDKVYIKEQSQKTGASVYAHANVMLTKALRQLIKEPLNIGFLIGHDEKHYVFESTQFLRRKLRIEEGFEEKAIDLKHGSIPVPSEIDVLVMHATPNVLGEREQFQIDQFIMRGGKILFFTAPLIPPTNTGRNVFMPAWSKGDESWTNFINKYGFKIETDEVVFDDECFIANTNDGEIAMNFAVNVRGDRLTNHPVCAGVNNVTLFYNNVIKQNKEIVQPDAKFDFIFNSSNKAWSVSLDYDIRQDPLMRYSFSKLTGIMKNPPDKRNSYVLAASVSGKLKSAYKQGKTPKFVDKDGNILDATAYERMRNAEPVLSISSDTRIIVSGNSIGYLFWTADGDNPKIIVNMINYLAFGDDYLRIEQKMTTFSPLDSISSDQKTLIRVIVIGAMPILLIVLGFFLLIYRVQSKYYDQAVFELRRKRKLAVKVD